MFSKPQQPETIFQTRVNQSVLGLPFPVVMGTGQVQSSILWVDGLQSQVVQGGGKSKGSVVEAYTAYVVAALCNGPINGVGDIWSGQSWLGSPVAAEQYTISGGGIYTPNNTDSGNLDAGVGVQNAYSGVYNDLGASAPTSLSGTDLAKMKLVSYGTTLTTGLYSINPADGTYHFNTSADAGKTVLVYYASAKVISEDFINNTETDLVPASKTLTVPPGETFGGDGFGNIWVSAGVNTPVLNADLGVRDAITTAAFKRVSGTPTVAGTYAVAYNYQSSGYNKGPAVYTFSTADINREVIITFVVLNADASLHGSSAAQNSFLQTLSYTVNPGTAGQSPYALLTASYPGVAFGYTNLATILYSPMQLGSSGTVQQNRFEVVTPDVMGSGIQDCNPIDCISRVLTNQQWGLGVGPVPFPTAVLDNGALGTWGAAAGTPGARTAASTAWNWFTANSFFISPVLDSQDSAASAMGKWLEAGMCAAFMSEGLLKIVPYGDTSCAGNGATWIAPSAYIVALDDTSFISKEGEDPVKITRTPIHDAWNVTQIQWDNRFNQYAPEITQEFDQGLINQFGERREDPQTWGFIHTVAAATFAANLRLKRGVYIRNTYEFTLPYNYSYLEPMDIVTISTTSVWSAGFNNVNLGINNLPVRITKIVDDPAKGLTITAEDYPFGAHQPTLYNKQISTAVPAVNLFADPGLAEVVMFEATNRLTGFDGDQIWIGACGTSEAYGSCNIFVSQDGVTYQQIGSTKAPAIIGVVASPFGKTLSGSPPAYDPDYVDNLVIDLAVNTRALVAGTTANADADTTLCFVDGELISYSTLTVTGQNQVTMSGYIRRGQMGSSITSHGVSGTPPLGGLFMYLDNTIFKYTYDPTWRGETLYFKFQAVNGFGNAANDITKLVPVTFVLPGVNPGSIDAQTGLLEPSANPNLYKGAYSGSVAYIIGNEVTYSTGGGTGYYVCILNTTGHVPTNGTYWQLVANNTSVFLGAYNSATAYVPGNQVTYSGGYYICIANTTGNSPTNTSYWQLLATTNTNLYLGAYSGSTAYVDGNQVSYNNNYYICISATTGNAPTNATYWTLVGTSAIFIGAYSGGTSYLIGNQVSYNNNYYICIAATTGNLPTNGSYWVSVTGNDTFTGIGNGTGSAGWYKIGTIVFGNIGESVSFDFIAGYGYNTNVNQQTITTIVMRTGNNSAAPNLSGITWSENGGVGPVNAAVLNVKAAATGGSTSASNLSWDLYMYLQAYSAATLIVSAGNDCSWTLINTSSSDPGAASSTVVVGIGGYGLNGVNDGTTNFSATASTLTYRPLTNPLTGHDAGSNATINIASFTMRTSSKGDISISSGSITGLSYNTLYYVYYSDAALNGGAVTFAATTTKSTVLSQSGYFFVGSIVTPKATAPDTVGNNDGGVGAQAGGTSVFLFGAVAVSDSSTGTSAITNANNSFDGNLTTDCTMVGTSVANGGVTGTLNMNITLSGASASAAPWSSLTLYILTSVTGVAHLGHAEALVEYSLDGGNSYTNIFDDGPSPNYLASNRALTTDSVALPIGQNLSLVRVHFKAGSGGFTNHGDISFNVFEAYIVGTI